jgi:hypothetical protein
MERGAFMRPPEMDGGDLDFQSSVISQPCMWGRQCEQLDSDAGEMISML